MRTLGAALMLLLGLALGTTGGAAQQDKPAAGQTVILVERIQDINLTDAQEAKIAEIQKESTPKVQEAVKGLAALVKDETTKVHEVLNDEQKKKLQELKEERAEHRQECLSHALTRLKEVDLTDAEMAKIGEIRKEYRPKIEKAMTEFQGLLTEEQKKAREDALKAGKPRKEVVAALQLTGAQKDKVESIAKDVATFVREESEKIHDVLSEGEKQKLTDLKEERAEQVRDRVAHRIANLRDLNLTDEQKTKLANIRQEFAPKIHEAGNKI